MPFTWDTEKDATNQRDHGIPFAIALHLWDSPTLERHDDREDYGEDRYLAVGTVDNRILAVVFTEREPDTIHLLSARKATTNERKDYEAYLSNC